MDKGKPIFYNALMLTAVNLMLRFVSTSFQVYLSGKIGPEGIGLLQLVLSVGALTMTAGMGGIRTATMYLSAEVVGQKRNENMIWVLSGCITYSIALSGSVGILIYHFAPLIAEDWIGNTSTVSAVRLLSCFLPVNCLCGVLVGYFTGVNRIGTLAAVEVAEQIFTMFMTVVLLHFWAGHNTVKACLAVIMGSGLGACFTLTILLLLKSREKRARGKRISLRRKLWETAVPLAIADDVKAGISTTENLLVPKRLSLYSGESSPLAAFGMVCGMVFPVLMFPAAILFGLAELLIPEMARCNAAGSKQRIIHLAERSLLLALIYGCLCGGILYINADRLCVKLYKTPEAGQYLRWFSVLAPMLYCDAITDAMIKGLGQQKISVRYNIITSAMDVALLFVLLPSYGMKGYYFSFLVTHLINFIFSIRLLFNLTGKAIQLRTWIYSLTAALSAIWIGLLLPMRLRMLGFLSVFATLIILFGVIRRNDLKWIRGLIRY